MKTIKEIMEISTVQELINLRAQNKQNNRILTKELNRRSAEARYKAKYPRNRQSTCRFSLTLEQRSQLNTILDHTGMKLKTLLTKMWDNYMLYGEGCEILQKIINKK